MWVRPSLRALVWGVPLALVAGVLTGVSDASSSGVVTIKTVSNRADLVSGNGVLVKVTVPRGSKYSALTLRLNGRDITRSFRHKSNGHGLGVVAGLHLGRNRLVATLPDGRGARLTITDHPIGGPVFAGPQIQPWTCTNGVKNPKCLQKPTFTYTYIGVDNQSHAYDPSSPPSDGEIAKTTTTEGVTVPFIIRKEVGYIDRDQYAIATLWQPGKKWHAWAPQKQFNHRLVVTHGASCDEQYGSASAPDVMKTKILGAGFVVMSNALDNAGHNCNIITQAEALVMTKEYVVDHYGTLRWTIGMGCSGGSLVQQQVANAYPGFYQGITPQCSFTDALSSGMQYVDYDLLLRYFQDPSRWDPGTEWDPVSMSQVLDHPNIGNPISFTKVIPNNANPTHSCANLPKEKQYDPQTNRKGVRCTLQDYSVNIYGKRPQDGFARGPWANEGIQYGLKGLLNGTLTPAQFVDLNTNVGGFDIDNNVQPQRTTPDLIAMDRGYRSGAANEANNLDKVAIIDLRGPDPGAFHDVYRTYAMRARLIRNFGTAANQVLWRGQAPLTGDSTFADAAVFAVDKWLARVAADDRHVPLPQKIIEDKPGDVTDRCTNGSGKDIPSWECDEVVEAYGTPRIAAGMPLADDTLDCQLKPMIRSDYPVTFTDEQWSRLQKAFPRGVCDYSKPGQRQHGAVAWLTYQDSDGHVIYGGKPLGPAPRSVAFRG